VDHADNDDAFESDRNNAPNRTLKATRSAWRNRALGKNQQGDWVGVDAVDDLALR
jgi:hypothetical protein